MFNRNNPRGLVHGFLAMEAMAHEKRVVDHRKAQRIALEEEASGIAKVEDELVFYAHMTAGGLGVLKGAELIEAHEQWELRIEKEPDNATAGRMRVRKTTAGADIQYVRTTKTKTANGAENEVALPSSVDEFEQFMAMSPRGMIKTRHVFPIEGMKEKWEVDTYLDRDTGEVFPWMKIDLELDPETDRQNFALPHFPVGLVDDENYHVLSKGVRSQQLQDAISWLYEYIFITPNPASTKADIKTKRPAMPDAKKMKLPEDQPLSDPDELVPDEPADQVKDPADAQEPKEPAEEPAA